MQQLNNYKQGKLGVKIFFQRIVAFFRGIPTQKYINTVIVVIGLAADVISLALFFGAINSPPNGSNFYINSREYLAWVLVASVYSIGLINAWIRRRWRIKFGNDYGHSISNIVFFLGLSSDPKDSMKLQNFKRDYSVLFVLLFPFVFLFSRAITATENNTGITGSPWGDLAATVLTTSIVTPVMMLVTSMFDFTMSMFVGETGEG